MKLPLIALMLLLLHAGTACQSPEDGEAEQEQPLTAAEKSAYLSSGKEIAQATFAELSGKLSEAMEKGGVPNALKYCNVVAYPLVDSLSKVHNAVIRRTSLKVRNPEDAPTGAEKAILEAYHEQAAAGEELQPRVMRSNNGRIAFYAPINIQPLCLECHGKVGEDLKTENYKLIRELYPNDEAVGYELGDLRGMWSISFKEDRK